jgi:hypothetical protein
MPRTNRVRRWALHNTSLDASGGCALFRLIGPSIVDCRRAAASTPAFGGYSPLHQEVMMRQQSRIVALLIFLIAVTTFSQSNVNKPSIVFHTNELRWDWAGTTVKDVFSPYTVESIHITKSYARSEDEKQQIVKTLSGLIRSDNKFAGGLSLTGLGTDLEAIIFTKEGKLFIVRRVSSGIYKFTSEEKSGHVIFIDEDKKKP